MHAVDAASLSSELKEASRSVVVVGRVVEVVVDVRVVKRVVVVVVGVVVVVVVVVEVVVVVVVARVTRGKVVVVSLMIGRAPGRVVVVEVEALLSLFTPRMANFAVAGSTDSSRFLNPALV